MTKRIQKDKFKKEEGVIPLFPMNNKQAEYIEYLRKYNQVIVTGCAGTGKTYISSTYAARLYATGNVDKIILTRPNVASGRSLGFFPGSMEEKIGPWVIPFTDVLKSALGEEVYGIARKKGNIDIVPFEVMRGRTFNNSIIILDEAQNTTVHEIKMFLTRIGEDSKVVINGDIKQSDLKETSGLKTIIDMIKKHNMQIPIVEFTVEDIVRSSICAEWVKAFDKEGL